jgi:hypothetical protein
MHFVAFGVRVVGGGFAGVEGGVGGGGEDSVEPCLLVLVPGCCECCARELFGVEAVGRLLGGVGSYGEGAEDGF